MTETPDFQPAPYGTIGLSGTNRGNDTQLTPAISIRQYRQRGVQFNSPPATARTGDFRIDDLTQHLVTYDSRTGLEYNNVYRAVGTSAVTSIPDNLLVQVPFVTYDTNNPLMSSVSGQITIDRKGKYSLFGYAAFDSAIGDRRIQIRVNNIVVQENTIAGVPGVIVIDSGGDTVTIPPFARPLNLDVTRLEYLNANDIVTVWVRQNSGAPLDASVYLIAYNI